MLSWDPAGREPGGRFARSRLPILLVGPTGTGKDLVARHLHWASGRAGAMVDVNCGALPRDMVESLLFGQPGGKLRPGPSRAPWG